MRVTGLVFCLAGEIFRQNSWGALLLNSQKTRRVEHQAAGANTLRGPCAVKPAEEEYDTVCVFTRAVSEQLWLAVF